MDVYTDYSYWDDEDFSYCGNPDMFEGFEDNSYACDYDYFNEDNNFDVDIW